MRPSSSSSSTTTHHSQFSAAAAATMPVVGEYGGGYFDDDDEDGTSTMTSANMSSQEEQRLRLIAPSDVTTPTPSTSRRLEDNSKTQKSHLGSSGRLAGLDPPPRLIVPPPSAQHAQGQMINQKAPTLLAPTPGGQSGPPLTPIFRALQKEHRGELTLLERYNYDLSKAQLKASSRTSALLAGFAMVALVELQYDSHTPHWLLNTLAVVTTLLVSVHLLALMMSTCILPYMEAAGGTQDSPHLTLKFYIDLSWLFSTCIGLVLFLVEIGIIFIVKFQAIGYETAGYVTTAMLIPVLIVFVVFSWLIHRHRFRHSMRRADSKVNGLRELLEADVEATAVGGVSSQSIPMHVV